MKPLLSNGKKTTDKETKMVAPLVGIAVAAAARLAAKKVAQEAAKKAAKAAAAKTAKIAKNSVKVKPRKTAPKTGLEGRGAKLTSAQQKERAQALRFDKQERNYEQRFDTAAGGPRAGGKDNGLPGKKNLRKTAAVNKAADKKLPIKINSNSSSRANRTRSGNKAK
jgi:hypothetical protein